MTVEQVHQEFLTAADVLMKDYDKSKRGVLLNKIDRLTALGFRSSIDTLKKHSIQIVDNPSIFGGTVFHLTPKQRDHPISTPFMSYAESITWFMEAYKNTLGLFRKRTLKKLNPSTIRI